MSARHNDFTPRLAMVATALAVVLTAMPPPVLGAGSPPPPAPPPPSEPPAAPASIDTPPDSVAMAAEAHARAVGLYKKGWKESEAAKADQGASKPKDAARKYAKALKHFDDAAKLNPDYYEAWNMVGYCARKTGDLKRAFAAYDKALALRPDYERAHEYLGEAYLMSGEIAKAKEQLEWLKEKQSAEAAELEAAIEAAEKGAPAESSKW